MIRVAATASAATRVRQWLRALAFVAFVACSSATRDATGPGEFPPTVSLTASQSRVTSPGDITLLATATGANGVGVQKVEFYEQVVGVDATPRKLGEDLEAPYEMKRSILGASDNGDIAFSAKDYDVAGHVGVSNSLMVTIAVPSDATPLQATVSASHTRITTQGHINFIIFANKPVARAEVYVGTTKVADVTAPTTARPTSVSVTRADNGTHAYVVKVYDPEGNVVESAPMTVEVDIRWDFIRPIDGVRSHGVSLVATDATNAVYFAGTTDTWDVFLVKHDADGNRLWMRTFGGPDAERANSVGVDPSGRIYIAANGFSPPQGSGNCFLAIYDPAGNLVRTQQIGGALAGDAFGCVAASDASGNFYIVGGTGESTQGHGFVIKYDRDGTELWTRKFGGTPSPASEFPNDQVTSIAIDALGGVYVAGYTGQSFDGAPNRGPRDIFVLKFDADGNRLWSSQYGTPGVLTFGDQLAADPDGGVYLAGETDDASNRGAANNALLIRYGSGGNLRWARTLDGGGGDRGWGVTADRRGIYLVGETYGSGVGHDITEPKQGGDDAFLAQLSSDGNLLSVRLLGTLLGDFGTGVAIGVNGDVYVAGATVYDQAATINTPMLARHHDAP